MKRIGALGMCLVALLVLSAAVVASAHKCECAPLGAEFKGGESRLATGSATFRSKQSSGQSVFVEATRAEAELIFEGVEAEGGLKCQSAGEPSGTVKTLQLAAELGWISKASQEVGLDFKPRSSAYVAEFECQGLAVKLKGSVIGHLGPANVMGTDLRLDFFGTEGVTFRNEPESFEGASRTS